MRKKIGVLTFFVTVFLFLIPVMSLATTVTTGYYGSDSDTSSTWFYADSSNQDDYITDVTVKGSGSGYVIFYDSSHSEISRASVPNTVNAPSGAIAFSIVASSGEVHATLAHTTNPNGDTVNFDSGGFPDSPSSSGGSVGSDCSSAVCECIGNLQSVASAIKGSVDSNGQTLGSVLDSINNNGSKLDSVKNAVDSVKNAVNGFHDEFDSDKSVSDGSSDLPSYDVPNGDGKKEKYAPTDKDGFKDTNTYFKDNGEDTSGNDNMPDIPEPSQCWNNVGNVCQEEGLTPEGELNKDDEGKPDDELTKDKFTQDGQLTQDEFTQDGEMTKDKFIKDGQLNTDSEMTKDLPMQPDLPMLPDSPLIKDAPIGRDTELNSDSEMTRDNNFNRTEFYNQTWP